MFTFTRNRLFALLAIVAVLGGIIGLSACSGSSSAPPQNATQILKSDGYTPSSAYTSALQGGLDGSGGTVTSSQVGTNSSSSVQAVIVFDSAADAQAGEQGVTGSGEIGFYSGITPALHGDVLTMTGPLSAWAAAGNSSGGQ